MSACATISLSREDGGMYDLSVHTRGDTNDEALSLASVIFDAFTANMETYVRVAPEAHSSTDFDTKQTQHSGFVRCSFYLRPGSHHMRVSMDKLQICSLGVAERGQKEPR